MAIDQQDSNNAALKKSQTNAEALYHAYHNVFDTDAGKKVLEDLTARCFGKMSPCHPNPTAMAANVGMQAVLFHIRARLEVNPAVRGTRQEPIQTGEDG